MEIVSTTGVNGAVSHAMLLSKELARRGHRMTLVCLPDSWIRRKISREPVRIVESDLRHWRVDEVIRMRRVARSEGVEVIHTHMSRANFFGQIVSWATGIPCVAAAHAHNIQPNWMFHRRVIAPSQATARFHRRYNLVRRRRLDVVHNFVDVRSFVGLPVEAREEVRASLGVNGASLVIGTVGAVIPKKGLGFLVRSLGEIRAMVPDVRLVVVGSGRGDYIQRLKDEAKRSGVSSCILWAGHCGEVPRLLQAMDVFVHPSLRETLPTAVIEAMASALPVVATTVAGTPECVVHGETGFLVPPADHRALAGSVTTLLRNEALRARFGAAGRARALEGFSVETQVPKIEAVLSRAVAGAGRRGDPLSPRR